MEKTDISSVNKFDGQNYVQWKFQMKCALKAKGIFDVVDGSVSKPISEKQEELQAWIKKDALAMFTLTTAMELNQITLIENCESSQEVLVKLDSVYLQKTETNKMLVHERFHQYKMNPNDSVAQHIAKVENLAKMIKETGEIVSDAAIMTKILSTLPAKFRNLRQAWLSLDESKQTITNLTARLLDEENSLSALEESEVAMSTMSIKSNRYSKEHSKKFNSKNPNKSRIVCYNCHKRGHISRNCWIKKRNGQENNAQKNENLLTTFSETAFNVEQQIKQMPKEDVWIMDSGASAHMTYRRDYFNTFTEFKSSVLLSNNTTLEVLGKGTVKIQKLVDGQWENATINDVLFVPNLRKNLFSEGVVTRKGMSVLKQGEKAIISDHNVTVAYAVREENNIYKMQFRTLILNVNLTSSNESVQRWHDRLGHLNVNSIRQMVTKGLVSGINLADLDKFVCEGCAYGKQHKQHFQETAHVKMRPGERVYSDVCGPMSTPSVQGSRYFVSFKDESSGYRVIYFLKHKSDVLDCFKDFNAKVKNKFGRGVQILHVDNGTEYKGADFRHFLKNEGITVENTAPYTPQQNGRAERDNRTIVESARSMLYAVNVPKYLWAEAVNTAVYILNRTPTRQTPGSTPIEVWSGNKPDLRHLKTFGCEAFVHVPDEKRTKLEAKSRKLLFVGYDKNSTNYRLFDPVSRKITISRNVIFNEDCKSYIERPRSTSISVSSDDDITTIPVEQYQGEKDVPVEENDGERTEVVEQPIPELRPQRQIKVPTRYEDFELNSVEFDVPSSYDEALQCANSKSWKNAIDEELEALKENHTWDLIKRPLERNVIGNKWVFKVKRDRNGSISRYKARLCAKGFAQREGVDYNEIFSPTTRYDSIRVLLSIAAQEDSHIMQFDVKTAFLHGELQEEIFMEVPKGALPDNEESENLVCKLNKSLYGLKQAPRCWNKKINEFLTNYGFEQSEADKCIYKAVIDREKVLLALYVDDGLVICKNKQCVKTLLRDLMNTFKITFSSANYFVGLEITKTENGVFMCQKNYVKQVINRFNMTNATPVSVPEDTHQDLSIETGSCLSENDVPYRQAIGSLMFLAIVSRPDIAHAVGVMSRYVNKHTRAHWEAIKRIIRYLIGTIDYGIEYHRKGGSTSLSLVGFTDADFAGDSTSRKSTSGYVFKISYGAVSWSSRRQQSVSLSTTEAEYVAASDAVKEVLWLQQLLTDLGFDCLKPTIIFIDNQSAIRLIKNPEFHSRTKHISVRYHFIREKFECGVIIPQYIESSNQEADIFTKALPRVKHEKFRDLLGVKCSTFV